MTDAIIKLTKKLAEVAGLVLVLEAHLELFRREGEAVESDLLAARMQRDSLQEELAAALVAEKAAAKVPEKKP